MHAPKRPATTGRKGSASGRPRPPGRHEVTAPNHNPTTTRTPGSAHAANDDPTGGPCRRRTPGHERTVAGDRKGPRRGLTARPDKPRRRVHPTGKHHSSSPNQQKARQARTACPSRRTSASGGQRGASQNPRARPGADPQGYLPIRGRACSGTPSTRDTRRSRSTPVGRNACAGTQRTHRRGTTPRTPPTRHAPAPTTGGGA
jgi:hypothetical protein